MERGTASFQPAGLSHQTCNLPDASPLPEEPGNPRGPARGAASFARERLFVFLLDGARADTIRDLMDAGELRTLRTLVRGGGTHTEAVTCFPSTTGPAYLPILSGRFPGHLNLPGIRWLDRGAYEVRRWSLDRVRSYVGLESFLMNRDLAPGTITLFDHFPGSANIFSPVSSRNGGPREPTPVRKAALFTYAHYTEHWEAVDGVARLRYSRAVQRGAPFIFGAFLALDELSHHIAPDHERVLRVYRSFDRWLGRLCDRLADRGELDRSAIVVVSDHGMTPVERHFELTTFCEQQGLRTFAYPRVYRHWRDAECAVMVSGNAMANLYLRRKDGWGAAQSYDEIEAAHGRLVERLCARPEVDFVAARDGGGGVIVRSRDGAARIQTSGRSIRHTPLGGDPLGLGACVHRDAETSLRRTWTGRYPDVLVQLLQVFASQRTGDLVVSAGEGSDLRYRYEHPEHRASHGSFQRAHMIVPLLTNLRLRPGPVRTADVCPTLLSAAGRPIPAGLDGRSRLEGQAS
ncbi:MAG: alkaline phosphatase family protein [Nitrospirae bacterium]|nr:alkaline phosphatase family protein [Nitrospirota bacterium]